MPAGGDVSARATIEHALQQRRDELASTQYAYRREQLEGEIRELEMRLAHLRSGELNAGETRATAGEAPPTSVIRPQARFISDVTRPTKNDPVTLTRTVKSPINSIHLV